MTLTRYAMTSTPSVWPERIGLDTVSHRPYCRLCLVAGDGCRGLTSTFYGETPTCFACALVQEKAMRGRA